MKKIIYKTCLLAGLFVVATACGKKQTETESVVTKVDNNIVTLTDAQFKNA